MKFRFLLSAFCSVSCLMLAAPASASVILQDDFGNGVATTGATYHPNQWYASNSNVTETNGSVTIATPVATAAWGQTLFSTGISSSLNFFNQPLSISVRDFASGGTGATETSGQNFRLGLLARSSTSTGNGNIDYYQGGNDGIALSITNGRTYALRYKLDRPINGDPHLLARALEGTASGTLATGLSITGFDLNLATTNWSMTLFVSDGSTLFSRGDWAASESGTSYNLADGLLSWGNATDGWGSSALVMQAQKGIDGSGSVYMSLGSLVVTPEPSRAIMAAVGLALLTSRRRR